MSSSRKPGLLVALALASFLAGCGGRGRVSVASCLNDRHGFLVQQTARGLTGQSPSGVGFTLTFYEDAAAAAKRRTATTAVFGLAVVDFGGNPGSAGLSRADLDAIRACLDAAK